MPFSIPSMFVRIVWDILFASPSFDCLRLRIATKIERPFILAITARLSLTLHCNWNGTDRFEWVVLPFLTREFSTCVPSEFCTIFTRFYIGTEIRKLKIFFKLPDKSTNAVIDDEKNYDVCVCVMYGGVLWNERKDRVMDIKFQRLEKPQAKTYDYYSLFT